MLLRDLDPIPVWVLGKSVNMVEQDKLNKWNAVYLNRAVFGHCQSVLVKPRTLRHS